MTNGSGAAIPPWDQPRQCDWSRREFLKAGLAGAAGVGLCGRLPRAVAGAATPASAPAGAGDRPNIILAMTDDQGWGDVGYMSKFVHTPTLDEMASKGLRFNRFYAAAPVCSPTRASCLTGRHPNRCGCFSWGYDVPLAEVTVAEAVRAAGYTTGHFGKWHLGGIPTTRRGATNRGKRQYAKGRLPHPGNQGFDEWFSYWNYFDLNPPGFHHNGKPVGPRKGEGSEITADRAVTFIRQAVRAGKPFLAVVWFGNPHNPHQARGKDMAHYGGLKEPLRRYYGEITAIDRAMGQLRAALRELGAERNTMLWFCSDNGARTGSTGGLKGRKGSLWEGGVRVPGILEWPARIAKPFATDVPACTSDYYPTILDLLGIRMPRPHRPIDGISLRPLIEGKMTQRPKPIGFEVRTSRRQVQWATLVDNRYKLHKIKPRRGGQDGLKLFDLVKDPNETSDLASTEPKVAAAMQARLEAWQASVERSLAGADYRTT